MLTKDEPYQDLGADSLARRNDEAHARRLVAQLERLGHTVQLDAASNHRITNIVSASARCADALTRLRRYR